MCLKGTLIQRGNAPHIVPLRLLARSMSHSRGTTQPQDRRIETGANDNRESSRAQTTSHRVSSCSYYVALEMLNGKQFIDQLDLPEDCESYMHALRRWHKDKLGPFRRAVCYMVCRQYYIGIGQIRVWDAVSNVCLSHADTLDRQQQGN